MPTIDFTGNGASDVHRGCVGVIPQDDLDNIALMWALQPPDLKLVPWLHRQADNDSFRVLALTGYVILTGVIKKADDSLTMPKCVSAVVYSPAEIARHTDDLAGGLHLSAAQIDVGLRPAADAWLLTRQRVDDDFVANARDAHKRLRLAKEGRSHGV